MSDHGITRGFRPSRMALRDEYDDDSRRSREANVETYLRRAAAGLPLFDGKTAKSSGDLRKRHMT